MRCASYQLPEAPPPDDDPPENDDDDELDDDFDRRGMVLVSEYSWPQFTQL